MQYLHIPKQIPSSLIASKATSWSPSMYRRVEIPNRSSRPISELLTGWDKGGDPGSLFYMDKSRYSLIRTKALQEHSMLINPRGAVTPLNPRAFVSVDLEHGDILLSKDSNIGECAMVDGDRWKECAISGGIVRLRPSINRFYLFAFLKHPIFREELYSKVPRGATIAHANTLWLDCKIPFPSQPDGDRVERYVAALAEAIFEKEIAIRQRDEAILGLIQSELDDHQSSSGFRYSYPASAELRDRKRLDAAIYSREYKTKMWLVTNYSRGFLTPTAAGFSVTPGPSLEIKILLTRIDSDVEKPGFYKLFIPANISEYGTMERVTWLGTAKTLPLLQKGDVLFGEAGFGKGRTIVLIDDVERATTNAHGLYARRDDSDLAQSIFFRCIFHWYRHVGLIDLMAVGGSGGHFSPEYFDALLIPNFPDGVREEIVSLYHRPADAGGRPPGISGLVSWHAARNSRLGIWQLASEMEVLRSELMEIQESIIAGTRVTVPLAD